MPRKTDFCRLRDCVRDEIASALHDGGGRAREIARSVCAKHRDLIGVLGSGWPRMRSPGWSTVRSRNGARSAPRSASSSCCPAC